MYQVICVDDEEFVLDDLQKAIDWFGFNMEIALATTCPPEALSYIKSHPAHLLLTDISMPQMSGVDLIKEVKRINPSISILVLSAYDTFAYVRSAMQEGAENYLLKPLDPEELSESLSTIVSHLDNRSKISENFGPAMLTFRSNFVESWCKGNLSEEEFLTRASMLGVNLQLDNYTVILFAVTGSAAGRMPELFDALLSMFVGNYSAHFYFETPSRFVCILSSSSGNFNIFRFQNEINRLRPMMGFPFFVSVGSTVDNYADVSGSYHEVRKYACLCYTPVDFIVCRNFVFPMKDQLLIEQDLSDVTADAYLTGIESILNHVSPERRISLELAVVNRCISLMPAGSDEELIASLVSRVICDRENPEGILSYLKELVVTVQEMLESAGAGITHQYVNRIIEIIHDFSNKDISLKTLAAQLDMHPSYLGSIFHQQTGYYFNDYLNEERLKYAAKLMEDNSVRLKDISDMAGFSSQTYFNRQFKKYFNQSPNTYRKNLKMRQIE